ncbi:MAG: branched-chain amino acid ABC transporter permease [Oligoflexia bacterium]|nr:branched-chain amino acid ABC transporter permease [Oligoflexia bacterium]
MTLEPKAVSATGIRSLWSWLLAFAAIWLLHFFAVDALDPYFFMILMYSGINIILAVSLNLVNGFTGQFSIGHAGFMSVGGYVAAFLTTSLRDAHPEWMTDSVLSTGIFLLSTWIGGLAACAVGYVVGLPSLRLKGDYLAIVTLGFGEIIRVVLLNIDAVGGARGMPNIPPLTTFGWVYSGVLLTVFMVWRVVTSGGGRELLAVREDEIAAEATGVNSTSAKVRAFVLGSFFAGVAGALFAHYLRYLNPATFDFNRSFEIVIMVVLGGMGSITGSIIAAVFLTGVREALRPLQELTRVDFRMVIYSLMLILLMLTRPRGLFGTRELVDFLPRALRERLLGGKKRSKPEVAT